MSLLEHEEFDGLIEDDPINFLQAMQCSNLEKWIKEMNKEYNFMQHDKCNTPKYTIAVFGLV